MPYAAMPSGGPPSGGPSPVGGARVRFTDRNVGNLGLHVGDDPGEVRARRESLVLALGARPWFVDQVHGTGVLTVSRPPAPGVDSGGEADAIVLDSRGREAAQPLAAAVMVADCSPVALATDDGELAAVVHVGRAGLLAGVLEATIARLVALRAEAAEPGALHAALGPGICGACYEVGADVAAEVRARLPEAATTTRLGTAGVDVGAGVRAILARDPRGLLAAAGVAPGAIDLDETEARCTYEASDLYSYRRATHEAAARRAAGEDVAAGPARTGRFAAIVTTSR